MSSKLSLLFLQHITSIYLTSYLDPAWLQQLSDTYDAGEQKEEYRCMLILCEVNHENRLQ